MKPRLLVPLFIAALALVLGTVAAACGGGGGGGGGGGEPTLEEYFRKIDALSSEYVEGIDALGAEFDQAFESEEEQIEAVQRVSDGSLLLLRDFVGALDDVDPPPEVEVAHEESVDAGRNSVEVFEELIDRLSEVESASEMEDVLDDPESQAAGDRFTQTCLDLQDIADDNGIDVDLDCDADEG